MATNLDLNVFKYGVTLTYDELNKLTLTQRQVVSYINNKETNFEKIYNGVMSTAGFLATVVGLLFVKSTPVGIGAGIAGLASTLVQSSRTKVSTLAGYGETELLRIFQDMTNNGAKKVTLDLAYVKVYDQATLETIVQVVQGTLVKKYTY